MKRIIITVLVVLALLAASASVAGWTWDEDGPAATANA